MKTDKETEEFWRLSDGRDFGKMTSQELLEAMKEAALKMATLQLLQMRDGSDEGKRKTLSDASQDFAILFQVHEYSENHRP